MRKVLLLISLFIIATTVNAQIKKGSQFLGGSVSFQTNKSERENTSEEFVSNNVNIAPAYGVFIKDNLVIGGDINFSYSNSKGSINTTEGRGYGLGIFARGYKELGKRFYVFAQGRLGANYNKATSSTTIQEEVKGVDAVLSFYPGVSYAVNKKFHIEAGFNSLFYMMYSHTDTKQAFNPNRVKQNQFAVGTSLNNLGNIAVGMRFILE